jgi:exopolyphosphatase/guanosine-5'-triphosphate,3'-diphosphate pyrophosphatase
MPAEASRMKLEGLRADRIPVLPGGLAIMSAIFKEFGLERMVFSEGALRLGVLYDLLGRYHHDDLREATVSRFMQRYEVDQRQAARVADTASRLLAQLVPTSRRARAIRCAVPGLGGAACTRSAYRWRIPATTSTAPTSSPTPTCRASRGGPGAPVAPGAGASRQAGARPAVARRGAGMDADLLPAHGGAAASCARSAGFTRNGFHFSLGADGLNVLPLTAAALEDEAQQWAGIGGELRIDRLP